MWSLIGDRGRSPTLNRVPSDRLSPAYRFQFKSGEDIFVGFMCRTTRIKSTNFSR